MFVATPDGTSIPNPRGREFDRRRRRGSERPGRGGRRTQQKRARIPFRTDVVDLFDRLLQRGVLVRDFSAQPRLSGCLRVSVGTPDENDTFIDALRECLA